MMRLPFPLAAFVSDFAPSREGIVDWEMIDPTVLSAVNKSQQERKDAL
jgi:hypothetical protein